MIRIVMATLAVVALSAQAASAAQVTYYQLPPDAYPHDVAPAPDGTVYYSGQRKGILGIFDPKTGKNEEVSLGKNAAPHGVIVGPDGAAWLTEGGQNAIARVDPTTRKVTLYPLAKNIPYANLNTAVFDKTGVLWFTGQSGYYGRVDPKTGQVDTWAAPRGSGAYGITVTPSGDVWYVSLASNYLARIDLKTGATAELVEPPRSGAGPRRVWSDSQGRLWVSFWHAGAVGNYDPATKKWSLWQLPVSKFGCYAVYVDDKDKVWVTDFSANAVLRFDPVSERFESFPSDKKGASVRQMLGRPGETWGGESGTDRLVVIRD
jgi:virginiamycin B lyase